MKGHFWWKGHFGCCFGPLWGPLGPLKRVQVGPTWHIIMEYIHGNCFRVIWGLSGQDLVRSSFYPSGAGWKSVKKNTKKIIFQKMPAEFFLFLATTYHFWVQIMILILVGQLLTLRVEFGLGEVCSKLWSFKDYIHINLYSPLGRLELNSWERWTSAILPVFVGGWPANQRALRIP